MWKGPPMDPAGEPGGGGPPSSKELNDLKDQYEQQQVLIAQLKEMLRRSEQSNVTQEKVEEYANTLTKMNARAKSSILRRSSGVENIVEGKKHVLDTPAKEKITLLRQQMEENKVKLAERGKMVSQLKAQLDDSQQIISQTSILPCDVKSDSYSIHSSSEDLFNIILNKEKYISDMTLRVQKLEANVLDLQENLKEKDQVIDARTKAITLMSESLSKKGKSTLDALDDTKEQMRKMQENFVGLEMDMKAEKQKLLEEITHKNEEIQHLKEINKKQEDTIFDLKVNNSELENKLEHQSNLVEKYKNDLDNYEIKTLNLSIKDKVSDDVENYKKEIEMLNNHIKELEETKETQFTANTSKSPQKSQKKSKKGPSTTDIDSLQKIVKETKDENNILLSQKLELENKIKELDVTIAELQTRVVSTSVAEMGMESEDISKLKKQLDESNKNMIKAKAQHKSKIKELNKKIDAFKKISDSNAEVVRLQTENSKLMQKIVELEEEKGNLQLKICESDSVSVDSVSAEHMKELEEEVCRLNETIKEKNNSIASLTQEIESCRSEMALLTEQLAGLSYLQNAQVTTEITSIHFEEQLDKMESEKKQILEDKETLHKENAALQDINEQLKKEKQEISAKLDNYMQENMELIDKLEKLSAEKVSSAESIEIVEALTQQEKLELEAYQKSLDIAGGNIKNSDENLDQNQELNESVNQLTEETSELLQRIELFTLERREVMEKMEALTSENNTLNIRIKEIENNRDTLIDTYEALQNEKEVLNSKLEILENEKSELQKTIDYLDLENVKLKEKLNNSAFDNKADVHIVTKQEDEDLFNEKQILEKELILAKKRLNEFEMAMNEKEQEIESYSSNLELHKTMLKDLEKDLKCKESKYEEDIVYLNSVIDKQNIELSHTEKTQKADFLTELEGVKEALKDNLRDMEASQQELQENSVTIRNLSSELDNLTRKIAETEYLLESKDDEIKKLVKDRDNKEIVIENLQKELKYNNDNFHKVCNELKERCLILQNQIEQNSGSISNIKEPLETKIVELTNKNKEQLEKMKKLAANLKKKTQAYQELEDKYTKINEKWENELKEKVVLIENQKLSIQNGEAKIMSLLEQLQEVESELANAQSEYKLKLQEYKNNKSESSNFDDINNLQTQLSEKDIKIASLLEENELLQKNAKDASDALISLNNEIESLHLASEKNLSVLNNKIKNLEMITETQEETISQYREEIDALRKELASTEEKRLVLQNEKTFLEEGMDKACTYYESASNDASCLKVRLEALVNVEEQLQKTLVENKELIENNQVLNKHNEELKHNVEILSQNLEKATSENTKVDNDNLQLQKEVNDLKHEVTRNESLLNEKMKELEKLESDMQDELIQANQERKSLLTQVELLSDQLKDSIMNNEVLKGEILEYKEKLLQQQNEFEATFVSVQTLEAKNNNCLATIQELNEKLEVNNNQTESLQSLIVEKEAVIENSKKQLEEQTAQLSQLNDALETSLAELSSVKEDLKVTQQKLKEHDEYSKGLVQNVAEDTVDNVVAQNKVETNEEALSTFVWPQSEKESVFDLIVAEEPHSVKTETPLQIESDNKTDTEELLKKVKTLEFMLYSVEKEKDDALLQCHELSNELTHLVYEREKVKNQSSVETQIIQPTDVATTSEGGYDQLCHFQFGETKPNLRRDVDVSEPVVEEAIQPRSAYLCYNLPDTSRSNLDQPYINLDTFGENDDGWGCGSEEAKLEDAHRKHSENYSFKLLADQYDEKVRVLELERERHLEEIRQSQIKSGKLIKKLKEFKVRNEQLEAKLKMNADDSLNLDDAIQDELKSQIKTLENQLLETKTEMEKMKADKDRLSKKVEVLSSANERMGEIKEKHDAELLYLQQKNRELNSKFEQLEWGGDSADSPKKSLPAPEGKTSDQDNVYCQQLLAKIDELNETVKDLMLDNEELQAMLEEQRNIRISLEKSKSVEPISENMRSESEYLKLQTECNHVHHVLDEKTREVELLRNELKVYSEKNNELLLEVGSLSKESDLLKLQNEDLSSKLQNLQMDYERINQYTNTHEGLESSVHALKEENVKLAASLKNAEMKCEDLQIKNDQLSGGEDQIKHLREEKDTIFNELQNKNVQLNDLTSSLEQQNKEIETLKNQNEILTESLFEKDAEFDQKLATTAEQLASEWAERVDQRGSDVAESWKLHLESRETEFMQVEQQLQKQINEMEEKCNTLVNENNELRKNVDAEIRNEVDRISALQQQIYDRQQSINELTRSLQEKQEEINKLNQIVIQFETTIQERDRKIAELESALKELEIKFSHKDSELSEKQTLVNEISVKFEETTNECNKLKRNLQDFEITVSSLNSTLEDYKIKINEYQNNQSQFEQKLYESDSVIHQLNKRLEEMQFQNNNIDIVQKELAKYQLAVEEKQSQVDQLNRDLMNYQELNETVLTKESEINHLKSLIAEKERDYSYNLDIRTQEDKNVINEQIQELDSLKRRLTDMESHYEELLSAKDADLENLRLQLNQHMQKSDDLFKNNEEVFQNLQGQLIFKTQECEELQSKLNEQNVLQEEENKQLIELRAIIEEQVMKIEELKKELYEKSNDYDALIAQFDIRHGPQEDAQKTVETSTSRPVVQEDNLAEPVSRAELDLALYMLHQRDVRCEELTVELMQLLEERDTLQLKLSNALREKEEIRNYYEPKSSSSSTSPNKETLAAASTLDISGVESSSDATEMAQSDSLANKLFELKTVGYRKDKTLVDDQELRRYQELSIMQQHRDVAAKLPPEAAARLVDASYTLSRDVQSPSKVLLNWLWGRSIPKVNNV